MLRVILGVIAGFALWSVLWVGVDAVLRAVSSEYNRSVEAMSFTTGQLIIPLILSALCSVAAGFAAAWVARENTLAPWILGVILLIVSIFVQMSVWDKIPLWYNLAFWILLIPATVLGGRLRKG